MKKILMVTVLTGLACACGSTSPSDADLNAWTREVRVLRWQGGPLKSFPGSRRRRQSESAVMNRPFQMPSNSSRGVRPSLTPTLW
jgi:Tfp pilus assembly protein PilP